MGHAIVINVVILLFAVIVFSADKGSVLDAEAKNRGYVKSGDNKYVPKEEAVKDEGRKGRAGASMLEGEGNVRNVVKKGNNYVDKPEAAASLPAAKSGDNKYVPKEEAVKAGEVKQPKPLTVKEVHIEQGEDKSRMYINPHRGVYYNQNAIATHCNHSDEERMVLDREPFNEEDKTLFCANLTKIICSDFIHLMNYEKPQNDKQKRFVACLLKKFLKIFISDDLSFPYWAKKAIAAASWADKYLDFLSDYVCPGDKELYEDKEDKSKNICDEYKIAIKNLVSRIINSDYKVIANDIPGTVDNIFKKIVEDSEYEGIKSTAIKIRFIRLVEEKRTKNYNKIGKKDGKKK